MNRGEIGEREFCSAHGMSFIGNSSSTKPDAISSAGVKYSLKSYGYGRSSLAQSGMGTLHVECSHMTTINNLVKSSSAMLKDIIALDEMTNDLLIKLALTHTPSKGRVLITADAMISFNAKNLDEYEIIEKNQVAEYLYSRIKIEKRSKGFSWRITR